MGSHQRIDKKAERKMVNLNGNGQGIRLLHRNYICKISSTISVFTFRWYEKVFCSDHFQQYPKSDTQIVVYRQPDFQPENI